MCELCDVPSGKMGEKEKEDVVRAAFSIIKVKSPALALLVEKLTENLGTDPFSPSKIDPKFLTTRDIIGALIIAKTITHIIPSNGVLLQMFNLSTSLASLPQMFGVKAPTEPLEEGHFSSVQLLDSVPKAN